MPVLLKRKNGELTAMRNAEYIPFYYFIPKSILQKCGAELNSILRRPKAILRSRTAQTDGNAQQEAKIIEPIKNGFKVPEKPSKSSTAEFLSSTIEGQSLTRL